MAQKDDKKEHSIAKVTNLNSEMDGKARQWLRDNPGRRYLMDADATDIDYLKEHRGDDEYKDLTDDDIDVIEYGHHNGSLYKDYRENYDSKWLSGESQDRSDEYTEKGGTRSDERRRKAQDFIFSGEAFRKKRQ